MITKFNKYINENVQIVNGYWFPENNTYCSPEKIKYYALQFNKEDKIKFILKCLGDKYIENDLLDMNLDNIINNEISYQLITLNYQKINER